MRCRHFNKIFVIVLVGVCASVVLAQSAPLNATDVVVQNEVTVNQCSAGEPVALTGNIHVQYSVSSDPTTGANLFFISASNSMSGAGRTTGAQYAAADSGDYTVSSNQSSTEATVELKADLSPAQAGSGTPMTLVHELHITLDTLGNLSVQVTGNTTSCGGN
jgi:hypothetical protein